MIYYGLFQFACPGYVGEEWFLRAMEMVTGLTTTGSPHDHFSKKGKALKVSLVCHPCDWMIGFFLNAGKGSSVFFDIFVDDFLKCSKNGYIGNLFNYYKADTVMRIEDQPWALLELLESLDVPSELSRVVLECKRLPVEQPKWKPDQRRELMKQERKLCEKYDYF